MFSFENKNILVTGASSGIGKCIALLLSQQGANVIITGRNGSRLQNTFDSLCNKNNAHKQIIAELTNNSEVNALAEQIPQLNGVVFCAGAIDYTPAKQINEEKIANIFKINFDSQILLYQALHLNKKLEKRCSLVFISSVSALSGVPATLLYAASKAAITASVRVLASELSKFKIRVNSISPGLIKTPLLNNDKLNDDTMAANEAKYPLGMGEVSDIANATIFLLSDEACRITGIDLVVDGGYMLKQ